MNEPLGPTGKFPAGKISEDDCGQMRVGITHENGNVIVDFGAPMVWIGMPPHQAREFAQAILLHAEALENGQ